MSRDREPVVNVSFPMSRLPHEIMRFSAIDRGQGVQSFYAEVITERTEAELAQRGGVEGLRASVEAKHAAELAVLDTIRSE